MDEEKLQQANHLKRKIGYLETSVRDYQPSAADMCVYKGREIGGVDDEVFETVRVLMLDYYTAQLEQSIKEFDEL